MINKFNNFPDVETESQRGLKYLPESGEARWTPEVGRTT